MTIDVDISLLSSLRSLNTRSTFRVRIKWTILKPVPHEKFSELPSTLHQRLPPLYSTVHRALTALCTTHCSVNPTQSMQLDMICTDLNTQQSTKQAQHTAEHKAPPKSHKAPTAGAQQDAPAPQPLKHQRTTGSIARASNTPSTELTYFRADSLPALIR